MTIHTGTTVEKLETGKNNVTATLKGKDGKTDSITVDRVILAVGIVGNTENLGLEAAGVKVERGHIVINEWGETGVPGLYAIGDVAGPPWLAHKASHEAVALYGERVGIRSFRKHLLWYVEAAINSEILNGEHFASVRPGLLKATSLNDLEQQICALYQSALSEGRACA